MKKFFLAIVALITVTATTAARAADGTQGQNYNWGGFYLGADIGYGWGEGDTKFTPLPSAAVFINLLPQTLNPDPRGVLGGAHVGYNWQGQGVVIGGEVDISGSDMRDSVKRSPITQNNGTPFPGAGFLLARQNTDVFGTVRPRFGISLIDRLLIYGTGGLAWGHINYKADSDFRPVGTENYPASFSKTKVGWALGAGLEYAVVGNWSVRAEYLHIDLGDTSKTINPAIPLPPFQVRYRFETQANIARLGVSYKF